VESTANSDWSTVINSSLDGSWSKQVNKTPGTTFGFFTPSMENETLMGEAGYTASDYYELTPGSGDSTYLGTFKLHTDGSLTFSVEPGNVFTSAKGFYQEGEYFWNAATGWGYKGFYPYVWIWGSDKMNACWGFIYTTNTGDTRYYWIYSFDVGDWLYLDTTTGSLYNKDGSAYVK
jgi:hypothetical protein